MKTRIIISIVAILMIAMFTDCNKEPLDIKDIDRQEELANKPTSQEKRGKPDKPGKPGEGEPQALYSATYAGIISSPEQPGYFRKSRVNPKYNILSGGCGQHKLSGLDQLFEAVHVCFSGQDICGKWREIRQYEKKNNPELVAVHLWFVEDGLNQQFSMFGTIDVVNSEPPTIFATEGNPVNITFNRWRLDGSNPECSGEGPIVGSMTIKYEVDTSCPTNIDCPVSE